ncbi:MAG: HEAT repeat domain-containing protein, partial [Candidatus Eiseniibacteriota bacterium]
AVQESLGHESPRVRAEAVKALLGHRMSGEGETVSRFLEAPEEELRRAAVHYRLAFGPERERFAREALENDKLRDSALDIMAERPELAHGAVTLEWVDARIKRGSVQDLLDAARALVHVPGERGAERLRILLHHADPEVRRGALRAIALRPDASFLEEVTALLGDRDVGPDARNAMVAFGEAAVPRLARLASEGKTNTVRWLASMALARVRTKGARRVLLDLARSSDPVARYHGLRNLNRIGARIGRRLVSRPLALRMFLREIRELKTSVEPWRILRTASTTNAASGPALELLAASYRESADRALERSLRALGLHHDPRPFRAVYEALRTADSREATSRAMEYLAQMLPRKVFRVTQEVLDRWLRDEPEGEEPPDVEGVVRKAREADDAWLRACAVRAAHEHPEYDRALLRVREDDGPIVRDELRAGVALGGNGRRSDADRS